MRFIERNDIAKNNPDIVKRLAEKADISLLIARLLTSRGIDESDVMSYLYPSETDLIDPMKFDNMEAVKERILQAAEKGEKVAVYSDYDADGISGAAMLSHILKNMGIDFCVYIPDRFTEGYGTNNEAIKKLIAKGVKLIISVDCGIKSNDDVATARDADVDFIIIDHHLGGDALPDTQYIIDPKATNDSYPFYSLCGAALAFKVGCALDYENAMELIDIAGIATIGDMVELTGENRTISYLGLLKLRRDPSPAIIELARAGSIDLARLTSYGISFGIVPRLNAAGRMEHGKISYILLTTDDAEKRRLSARKLEQLNSERKKQQKEIADSAIKRIREEGELYRRNIVWAYDNTWEKGVVGLAASAVSRAFNRPAVIFCEEDGKLTGSARSIDGIDIHSSLAAASDCYIKFGGHAQAAGLTLEEDRAEEAMSIVNEYIDKNFDKSCFLSKCVYDGIITEDSDVFRAVNEIEAMEPFGEGNPQPVFMIEGARPRNITYMGDGKHIKFDLFDRGLKGVWFNASFDIDGSDTYTLVGTLSKNIYGGTTTVQFIIDEIVPDNSGVELSNSQEYVRTGLKDIMAFRAFLKGKYKYVDSETFYEDVNEKTAASPLGTLIVVNSSMGLRAVKKTGLTAYTNSVSTDSAENCVCLRAAGAKDTSNYKDIYAVGAFAFKKGAVYLFDDNVFEEYCKEAKEYFVDDDRLTELLQGFDEVLARRKAFDCLSDFLGECMIECEEASLKHLWFALNVYSDNKLIDLIKSDKIIFKRKKDGSCDWGKSKVYRGIKELTERQR